MPLCLMVNLCCHAFGNYVSDYLVFRGRMVGQNLVAHVPFVSLSVVIVYEHQRPVVLQKAPRFT